MYGRLLVYIAIGVVFLAACAKPPVAELEEARRVVAYAYASGASQFAAGEYQLASDALSTAEQQVQAGKFTDAVTSLRVAKNYSNKALTLTVERKQQIALEKKQAEERARLEKEQLQAELLRKQQEEQAQKEALKKPVPVPVVEEKPEEPKLVEHVEVAPADNLLTIAARPEVYNDGMLWPLIYKANRDQIKDPQEIFPGQTLMVPRDKTTDEIEAARAEAEELNLF